MSDASQADRTLAMISFLNERPLMQSLPLYGQINVQLHTQQEQQLNRGVLQMCFGSLPPTCHGMLKMVRRHLAATSKSSVICRTVGLA